MMIFGTALETLSVGVILPAIALISDPDISHKYPQLQSIFSFFNLTEPREIIIWGAITLACIFIVKAIYLGSLLWYQVKFAFRLQASLSKRLFTIYLAQPYPFYLEKNSAELINNVTSEISLFTFQGILPMMTLILETFVLIGVGILLVTIEPLGAIIIVFLSGLIATTFYYVTRKKVTGWGLIRQENDAYRLQHLQQGLSAIKEVKLYGRQDSFIEKFAQHSEVSSRIGHLHNVMQQYPRQWLELLAVLSVISLILIMMGQGKDAIEVIPVIGLFAMAAFRLMPSIVRILASMQSIRYGLTIIELLDKEIGLPSKPKQIISAKHKINFDRQIEFLGVCFSYPLTDSKVLDNVSMIIKKGTTVGIVGSSGAGKSTLIDILLGFFKPSSGEVTVDGNSIFHDLNGWQRKIGYVPQSIYLTDDSILNNVAFGLSDIEIDLEKIWNCLDAAQLSQFVKSLPDGLRTNVGERGVRLSGGQRQRIGIARALYNNPELLVFDESTNSLDSATAEEVMSAVNGLHGEKTILIISHQMELMTVCDEIYRVTKGRIESLKIKPAKRVAK
jgi:ABC-type multidrug transport system fused ATPase/permease subunit